jgi:prepilin-type N-terminal cleavage/methylation domain-containing protein
MRVSELRKRFALKGDSGLSLMEVIVAIAIMTIISTAAASLSINGVKTVATEERAQVAVTVANGTMEKVSGWTVDVNPLTGVSNLYNGRSKGDVQKAFSDYASRPGVAETNGVWDGTVPAGQSTAPASTGSLPVMQTVTQNGTVYTVATLIGSCYQQAPYPTSTAAADCKAAAGTAPDAMIRVIVIVKWTAGPQCAASGCYYQISTLLDPSVDLEWVTH